MNLRRVRLHGQYLSIDLDGRGVISLVTHCLRQILQGVDELRIDRNCLPELRNCPIQVPVLVESNTQIVMGLCGMRIGSYWLAELDQGLNLVPGSSLEQPQFIVNRSGAGALLGRLSKIQNRLRNVATLS